MPPSNRRPSRRTQPRNLADALLVLPKGTVTHDELTELALGLLSDLTKIDPASGAGINGKTKSLELLLKVLQDKREAEANKGDASTSLLDLLRGLK